jgi:hypothetical protein
LEAEIEGRQAKNKDKQPSQIFVLQEIIHGGQAIDDSVRHIY